MFSRCSCYRLNSRSAAPRLKFNTFPAARQFQLNTASDILQTFLLDLQVVTSGENYVYMASLAHTFTLCLLAGLVTSSQNLKTFTKQREHDLDNDRLRHTTPSRFESFYVDVSMYTYMFMYICMILVCVYYIYVYINLGLSYR